MVLVLLFETPRSAHMALENDVATRRRRGSTCVYCLLKSKCVVELFLQLWMPMCARMFLRDTATFVAGNSSSSKVNYKRRGIIQGEYTCERETKRTVRSCKRMPSLPLFVPRWARRERARACACMHCCIFYQNLDCIVSDKPKARKRTW